MLLPFKNPRAIWRFCFPTLLITLEAAAIHGNLRPGTGPYFVFRWGLMWLAGFLFCGVLMYPAAFRELINGLVSQSVRVPLLIGHFAALLLLAFVAWIISHAHPDFLRVRYFLGVWFSALLVATVCGALAFLRGDAIRDILRSTRQLWLYAALAAVVRNWAISVPRSVQIYSAIWLAATRITFALVKVLLHPLVANVIANPTASRIGTERFEVIVGTGCSGLEGVSLMLIFSAAWLWFFRAELRFPRSLLLMPACVVLIFLLNSVRIAALILIGHAGAEQIAVGGFHSYAGWILFACVAIGMMYAAQSSWLRQDPLAAVPVPISLDDPGSRVTGDAPANENATAVYLAPLFVILATAMVTHAASAGFDWLYPLRFVAAAMVFWIYRRKYLDLDWRFSGASVILGVAVFLLWIAPFPSSDGSGQTLRAALEALPLWGRVSWMAFRVLGATLTVPIAEELAFRGFALRRLQFSDFESVNWRVFTWPALLISSLTFGIMHGERWIAGTAAGVVYAAAMLRRGRIGDATVAHATTNALLAAWVITRGAWYLW